MALAALTATPPVSGSSEALAPWTLGWQLTYQLQGHGSFPAPYSGENSLRAEPETRGSFTTTFYVGRRLWHGAEAHLDLEAFAGAGLSGVEGLAGPPNGETYRIDSSSLRVGMARVYLRQTWDLGADAVGLTAGKFSATDLFDDNAYAHDPRTQFNNWSLWANAAWDYPADTRGYTWGLAAAWRRGPWAARFGTLMVPREANGLDFDHDVRNAHGEVLEAAHDHLLAGRRGTLRVLAYQNHARMGSYREALAAGTSPPDVTATRRPGRRKYGFGANFEQEVTEDVGVFARVGWNDGRTEAWAFTEVQRTLSSGVSVGGGRWSRPRDRLGVAVALNGTGPDHRDYLAAGGLGFMLGDGRLRYAPESVVESYYAVGFRKVAHLSALVQRFEHPAFNRDRGPVTVVGARLHVEFPTPGD